MWKPSTGEAEAGRLPIPDYTVSENQKGKEENELSHALLTCERDTPYTSIKTF